MAGRGNYLPFSFAELCIPFYPIVNINLDLASTACFADYSTELFGREISQRERNILRQRLSHKTGILLDLLSKEGYRSFLCPVGGEFGCIPASLALAKQLDLRIINLSPDRDVRQYDNLVEPFMQAAISCPMPTYGVEYLCARWILEHEYGMESGDREWRHLHTYSNFECEWNLEDNGVAKIYYNARNVISDTFLI